MKAKLMKAKLMKARCRLSRVSFNLRKEEYAELIRAHRMLQLCARTL
jgi:hypothetical protein